MSSTETSNKSVFHFSLFSFFYIHTQRCTSDLLSFVSFVFLFVALSFEAWRGEGEREGVGGERVFLMRGEGREGGGKRTTRLHTLTSSSPSLSPLYPTLEGSRTMIARWGKKKERRCDGGKRRQLGNFLLFFLSFFHFFFCVSRLTDV